MRIVYLIAGSPGSGKSWVCNQLQHKFKYVPHDQYLNDSNQYFFALLEEANKEKPVLTEAPFSVSTIKERLEANGVKVVPIFIIEDPQVLTNRYRARENRDIPQGHLTRQNTYKERAKLWNSFKGTSTEVLEHLRSI